MSDTRYVECCEQVVESRYAMPFYYADRNPVYLCAEGFGCTVEE